jgi:DNA repair exonuclease SbcCD ATPase subunit
MKLFKQYLKESLVVENTELADLRKHLHDQQMKYAAAQKRKDKRAMDFWNNAIKNTEEEIKYYENENFSSTSTPENKSNEDKVQAIKDKIEVLEERRRKLINRSEKINDQDSEEYETISSKLDDLEETIENLKINLDYLKK